MKDITFDWDDAKNKANTQKHGVSFTNGDYDAR
jgi:uncharacterized DUF497 family protein